MELRSGSTNTDRLTYRASFTSVVIARSSDSKTAKPSPYSSNARTLVASHGLFFSADNTRRASLRYVILCESLVEVGSGDEREKMRHMADYRRLTRLLPTGSRQEAIPPYSQVSTCHRRCFPRRYQGATKPKTRGPISCPPGCYQGG